MEKATIKGLQFDVLRSHDILKLSVIDDESSLGGIEKPKDLYDTRLGIPNEGRRCDSCEGSRRGPCDVSVACDGHFGHVELPSAIFHPYHVRRIANLLSRICLGCSRALKKKNRLHSLFLEDDNQQFEATEARKSRKRKSGEVDKEAKARKTRQRDSILKWFTSFGGQDGSPNEMGEEEGEGAAAAAEVQSGLLQTAFENPPPFPPLLHVKEEPIEYEEETLYSKAGTVRSDANVSKSATVQNDTTMSEAQDNRDGGQGVGNSENPGVSSESSCKYCGIPPEGSGPKFPKILLRVVTKVKKNGRIDSIRMHVKEKPGGTQLPAEFWDFVQGHPDSPMEKSRPLLPFEALKILREIPLADYSLLKMDRVATHPEAFILFAVPVTPNCNRLVMEDWSSTLAPRVIMGRGGPNSKLEALVSKVRQIKAASASIPSNFDIEAESVDELQLLVARHLRACKVVELNQFSKANVTDDTGGSLELKWLKAHVLSKRSNFSARTIVHGDPNIAIDEIGIPYQMALRLTVEERVSALNLSRWEKLISNIKSGKFVPPGPLLLKTQNKVFDLRERSGAIASYVAKTGDIFTRCLQTGDYVIANRPPSLHKHSLIALKVRLHHELTFAINPLICPPFDGDFDGDAFHIFVPQSVETVAELQELMSVSAQMVCPQGGQTMIALTQDTLLGAHLFTRSHVFVERAEMNQLMMFSSGGVPPPAVVKCPGVEGPLWTGAQLYSTALPKQISYSSVDESIVVKDGELLVCEGSSSWLQTRGIVKHICEVVGNDAALSYLNSAQGLVHQWLLNRGFSVGLDDYYVAKDRTSRGCMMEGVKRCLRISEEASLRHVLRLDKIVQKRILSPKPNPNLRREDIKHEGSFGLLLGDMRKQKKLKHLQRLAIEKFQNFVPTVDNLVYGYISRENSLLAMVKSGSKGSMSRLIQQTGCLGLQLHKGESLISIRTPSNKLFYCNPSLVSRKEDIFDRKEEIMSKPGYWESKGIITSSFLDGMNPAEFYLHALSTRGTLLREGIDEPNKIMRNLFLFMRDLYVAYDGSVRSHCGDRVIQFRYGGIIVAEDDPCWEMGAMSGEPVGALAATAIAEPSYSVKLDSYHSSSLLKSGPIQLLQETLFPRKKSTLKMRDRCVLLRLFTGFGVQRRALKLKRGLERAPLRKFVRSWALEFCSEGGLYEKVYNEAKETSERVVRSSPGNVVLCSASRLQKALRDYELDLNTIKTRLNREFRTANSKEGLPGIIFLNKFSQRAPVNQGVIDDCLIFFAHDVGEPLPASAALGRSRKKIVKEVAIGEHLKQEVTFETMMNVIIPEVLDTTVKGYDEIDLVKLVWEDHGDASRVPSRRRRQIFSSGRNADPGELVLEVHTTSTKGTGKRSAAFSSVKHAAALFMDDVDWTRSTPYSVQEIAHVLGVEAARETIRKRLALAAKEMGKPIFEEHLTLVADTVTFAGEVIGLSISGYREYSSDPSTATPFTEASFQEPKKKFFDMAITGATDNLEGPLTCAVWGKRVPLGTGAKFDVIPLLTYSGNDSQLPSKVSTGQNLHTDWPKNGRIYEVKESLNSLVPPRHDGVHGKHNSLKGVKGVEGGKRRNGFILSNGNSHPIQDSARINGKIDRFTLKIHHILHQRYEVGQRLDEEGEKMILNEVLKFHPRREEKVGCGISFLKVDVHPEYTDTKCFHIVRTDGSVCDFSYRKCLDNKAQQLL